MTDEARCTCGAKELAALHADNCPVLLRWLQAIEEGEAELAESDDLRSL